MNRIVNLDKSRFDFLYRIIKWHIARYFFGRNFPLIATFQLTNRCNFNCQMCNIKNNPKKQTIPFADFKKIIDDLSSLGCAYATLSGGEPLLIQDITEYVLYAKKKIPFVNLVTNGYLLSEDFAKEVERIGLSSISISMDGLREKNDELRGVKGAFERTVSGIRLLKRYAPGVKITINTVISGKNIEDIIGLTEFSEGLGVFHKFQPVYNHPDFKNQTIDYASLKEVDQSGLSLAIEYLKKKRHVSNSAYFLSSIPDYFLSVYERDIFRKDCLYPEFSVEFRENGQMYPCVAGKDWGQGYVVSGGVKRVLFSDAYRRDRIALKKCRKCRQNFSICYVESRLSLPIGNFIKYNF